MKLLIKNGRLIDPATRTDHICDILIEAGKIKDFSPGIETGDSIEIIDASGLVVSPGFIDIHVHLREPGQTAKEDIESGSKAAVHGGFTSIACMPNTSPVVDNISIVQHITHRAKEIGLLNIFPVAAISHNLAGLSLTDMEALVQAGVVGFSDDGRGLMNESLFRDALYTAKKLHVPIIQHPEDHSVSMDGQVHHGLVSERFGLKAIPSASENIIIQRDIRLQEEIDSYLHLTHISTMQAVDMIREAKKKRVHVTADVTPHHLLLDETHIQNLDSVFKMKPPLRSAADRSALLEALKSGVIDCIASDHAPHTREEKKQPFETAPFGVTGMETSFSVIYDRLVKTGFISLNRLIEVFSTNPARVLQLVDRGMVKTGMPADLTILDLEKPFKIREQDFFSKSANCPFIGWEGRGIVAYTIAAGHVVYKAGSGIQKSR